MGKRARQPSANGRAPAKAIRVGSDFSGIGTFNIAVKSILAKLPPGKYTQENKFCSDKDKACAVILKQTCLPSVFFDDVTARNVKEMPKVDVYSFTAPCTTFSKAGKTKASATKQALAPWPITRWLTSLKPSRRLWWQRMSHPLLHPATSSS